MLNSSTTIRHHRCILFLCTTAVLLLLSSFPQSCYSQETATATATTDDDVPTGDVTDLGDVVGDTMMDELNAELLVDDLDVTEDLDKVVDDEKAAAAVEEDPSVTNEDASTESSSCEDNDDATTATEGEEASTTTDESNNVSDSKNEESSAAPVVQSGPYIDLLGDVLLSLQMVSETQAQVHQHYTNEALSGKKVVGLYFSADWCGPCRQFTPDLVNFYNKMNTRRGKKDQFEIVWISRCRDVDSFGQYFTQMNWLALPPDEAMGQRGQYLGDKFKVKSIPTLVLLDEIGNVITYDGRNKIPMDKAGIGFPWRSPVSVLVSALVPRSFRLLVKNQFSGVFKMVKGVVAGKKKNMMAAMAK